MLDPPSLDKGPNEVSPDYPYSPTLCHSLSFSYDSSKKSLSQVLGTGGGVPGNSLQFTTACN